MSNVQWFILLLVALFAAVFTIIIVPRQKRALPFEVVMWLATWVVAALCAWLALGAITSLPALGVLALFPIAEIPILPLVLGAFGGALILTIPLWVMDGRDATEMSDPAEE